MNLQLTREFIAQAEMMGTQRIVILDSKRLDQLAQQAPEQFKDQFERLQSEVLKYLQTAVLVGIYGYDEVFAAHKKLPHGVGATGVHQNYWKLVNDAGRHLLQFLEGKGFEGKGTGEGMLPVKYVLNKIGIGKYGKNALIYSGKYGSYINNWFEMFTNAPLKPSQVEVADGIAGLDMCENCSSCIKACPTQAIISPYKVDRNRCITHLTHCAASIPTELFDKIDNWIWGCNVCQNVCPANAKVVPRKRHAEAQIYHPGPTGLPPAHKHPFPKLVEELDPSYDKTYLQNVLIAFGNAGNADDASCLEKFSRTARGLELKEYCEYATRRSIERNNTCQK
jgi:epoxyqueuosine reductase QueG